MASVSSLVTILRSAFSDSIDPPTICREAIQYWSESIEKFSQDREQLPSNRICDLEYAEISRDPLAAVRRIYGHFGWSLSKEAEQRMRALVAIHAQRQPGNHRYRLSQFGCSEEEVLTAFAPYCQRFGLSPADEEKSQSSPHDSSIAQAERRSGFISLSGKNAQAGG
jgi:hypothetical protein